MFFVTSCLNLLNFSVGPIAQRFFSAESTRRRPAGPDDEPNKIQIKSPWVFIYYDVTL